MRKFGAIFLFILHVGQVHAQQAPSFEAQMQVIATEKAFAKTMADRDFPAFTSFLSVEAVFFSAKTVLHGKSAVAAAWKSYFDAPVPSFSWDAGQVEVLESGTLALSTGPVRDANGKLIATFTSIWRLEKPGKWRIVFDKGNPSCECAAP